MDFDLGPDWLWYVLIGLVHIGAFAVLVGLLFGLFKLIAWIL